MFYNKWLFSAITTATTIIGTTVLYQDVMKNKSSPSSYSSFQASRLTIFIIILTAISLYLFFSIYSCWMNAKKDRDILRNYKPLSKKVKNMTSQQKKHRKQGNEALWRNKYLFCQYNGTKIISILSVLIAVFVVYPYTKKEKSLPMFILLVVLFLPLFFLTSAAFFLTLTSFHQFS